MITGLNHLTLSVGDLPRSLAFYHGLLGMRLRARWDKGAYLSCGELWICLSLEHAEAPAENYTHYAFSVSASDFPRLIAKLRQAGVSEWKQNRSEGDSFYCTCPDGHQLELHVGDLRSRLAACRQRPYQNMVFYDDVE